MLTRLSMSDNGGRCPGGRETPEPDRADPASPMTSGDSDSSHPVPAALRAPHYEPYFGAWAYEEAFFRAAVGRVA